MFGCDLSAAELAETAKAGVDTEVLDLTDRAAAAAWIVRIDQTTGGAVDGWSTMPAVSPDRCVYRLCHPNVVPMETAEPSD